MATLNWIRRLLSIGHAGYFEMDCPATFNRNSWLLCTGQGGYFHWNTHFEIPHRLGDMIPDAPHPDMLVPNCWLISDYGIYQALGNDDAGIAICDCPLYVASRIRDTERSEETLLIVIKVDKEWRKVYVPASAGGNAISKAVAGAGVIVSDHKTLNAYIMDIRKINKGQIPVETQESFESIFDRYGRQSCDTRKLEDGDIDVGNARFGGHEALIVFDNVFIPWSNVFMCGEYAKGSDENIPA